MRAIRAILIVFVVAVVGVLGYNYWSGYGWTLSPPAGGIDAEEVREKGAELAGKGAAIAEAVVDRTDAAASNATLTAKIKSKMALDDYVKARSIDVDSRGNVVTLTGTVQSEMERDRALRLARETAGVGTVVDNLRIVK